MKKPEYGDILGANNGVVAYANRGAKHHKLGFMEVYGIFTGFKYQCVEYVRRWLLIVKGLVFKEVLIATDVWDVPVLTDVVTEASVPMTRVVNGSGVPPKAGDLLIYRNGNRLPWGHIAVIVKVLQESVRIAEQNEIDHYWDGDYSRELVMEDGFRLVDKYQVIGWMTYASR